MITATLAGFDLDRSFAFLRFRAFQQREREQAVVETARRSSRRRRFLRGRGHDAGQRSRAQTGPVSLTGRRELEDPLCHFGLAQPRLLYRRQ
jgi:hypothetical protein